jgi:hypothetical protein
MKLFKNEYFLISIFYLLVILILRSYSLRAGFDFETGLIYPSDINPGLDGFLYVDPQRKFTSLFYHLSFLLGKLLNVEGSFVPYQGIYTLLWFARSLLTYFIVKELVSGNKILAFYSGLVASLHLADSSYNFVGQLNQLGMSFWMLLSFLFYLYAIKNKENIKYIYIIFSSISVYICLWSYESPLPVILFFPILIFFYKRYKNFILFSLIFLFPAIVFSIKNFFIYIVDFHNTSKLSYQVSSALSYNLDFFNLIFSLYKHIENSFIFWHWPNTKYEPLLITTYLLSYLFIFLIVFVGIIIISQSKKTIKNKKYVYKFLLLNFILLILSFLVSIIIKDNLNFWRTDILASFPASCVIATIIYLFLYTKYFYENIKKIFIIIFFSFISYYATLAGVNSGYKAFTRWEEHRKSISSILSYLPNVPDQSLIVLIMNNDNDSFRHNMWFDLAIRLSYPNKIVAGNYYYKNNKKTPGSNIDFDQFGYPILLTTGFPTLFHQNLNKTIDNIYVFNTNNNNEIYFETSKYKIVRLNIKNLKFCINSNNKISLVAKNRYGPILKNHEVYCKE